MFLDEIGQSPNKKFNKINRYLNTNYGFVLSEKTSINELQLIAEQLQDEIVSLKVRGEDSSNSSELSKRLLILEGVRSLIQENIDSSAHDHSPRFNQVIRHLVDYVVEAVEVGDDFDDAVRQAMKEYRSSRYRFDDAVVEGRLRQDAKFHLQSMEELPVDECDMSMMENTGVTDFNPPSHGGTRQHLLQTYAKTKHPAAADAARRAGATQDELKAALSKPVKEENWIHTDPSKKGMFKGKNEADINHMISSLKSKDEKHPGHVSAADKKRMHQLQFAKRAKNHDLEEADPWSGVGDFDRHAAEMPTNQAGKDAMSKLDNPSLSIEEIPMVRNKHGKMVPDPFAQHAEALRKGIVMKESENFVKKLRHLLETEVSQAEVMMASKGFSQELQEMIEKIGRLQNEDLPPVTDQMRETYGVDSSEAFQNAIHAALQGVMDALYTAKNDVDDAVSRMAETGSYTAQVDMDKDVGSMDDGMGDEEDLELDNIGDELEQGADLASDDMEDMEDEFGGAEEEEPLGRSKKMESVDLERKVMEMRRLVEKARKLKESRK